MEVGNFGSKTEPLKLKIQNSEGIALIMVLWVIAILSVIVLEFCFAMRTEVNIVKSFKEETQLYAIAEGGIHRAIAELVYKHHPVIQLWRKTTKPEEIPPERREWMTDGRPYLIDFDQGVCEIRIMSEAGKVDINTVSEPTLRKIIGEFLEGEQRDVVVDSILDWKDTDDFHRINGAENEYYQSLKEPYNCKNGPLDSIEELLLIRGITSDLFYGKKETKKEEGFKLKQEGIGLKDIFSVYALGEQVDINSAPVPVLRFLLGIPYEMAQAIVKAREDKKIENQQDLLQRVPELSSLIRDVGRFIIYQSAVFYYSIESRGKSKEGKSVQGVKVIIKIDSREKKGCKIIQWIDSLT
jgi:general secretion pathway protein K